MIYHILYIKSVRSRTFLGRNSHSYPQLSPYKVFQYHLNNHIQPAVLVVSLPHEKGPEKKKKNLAAIESDAKQWWYTSASIFSALIAKLGTELLKLFQDKNWI